MSNISKLEFVALDISGKNYLSWILDAEIHLDAMSIGDTIKVENEESLQNRAKAMIFLRHHLHDGLKIEYLTIKDPFDLWNNLKERYSHQKTVILPKARYDWMHLRLQDFKSYREKGFKKYSDLISYLLVAEQNNELLMKNHEIRPTGANSFPEVNVAMHDEKMKQNKIGFGRGRGRSRGRGRGKGRFHPYDRGHEKPCYFNDVYNNNNDQNNGSSKKCVNDQEKNVESGQNHKSMNSENGCYRCGDKMHWYNNCRTSKHLVDLYQTSKEKAKDVETNFMYQGDDLSQDSSMSAHFDVSDFFVKENVL
ncbi:uncharacterized protein [Henckelia pumila]|uniref:uncharacterized protein n=1 Tax=Henckelia pumila TaxID=405737 RepID=UPI003C6E4442